MRKSTFTGEYAALRARLTEIRSRAQLSQRQLADLLDVPHSWIAKVETGERRIDLVEFGWYCEACGASASKEASAVFESGKRSARRKGSR